MREEDIREIYQVIKEIKEFRFCGPSDDPDEQTSVIYSYKYLLKRFKYFGYKIQNEELKGGIRDINTDLEVIYDAYDAHSDISPLIDDILLFLERGDEDLSGNIYQIKYRLKRTIKEIKDYPENEWRRTSHFERLVQELNNSLKILGREGVSSAHEIISFQFARDHYSSSQKTINDRGYQSLLYHVEIVEEALLNENVILQEDNTDSYNSEKHSHNKVFIVHGRDEFALLQTENMIRRLGFEPIVLKRKANQGLTLIEKFEKNSEVKYAIVLLTPDDVGSLNEEATPHLQFRARQNVIFEMGFFYGKLGRSKVCCLVKSGVEKPVPPSDIDGIAYIPYTYSIEEKELDIMRELQSAGIEIGVNF